MGDKIKQWARRGTGSWQPTHNNSNNNHNHTQKKIKSSSICGAGGGPDQRGNTKTKTKRLDTQRTNPAERDGRAKRTKASQEERGKKGRERAVYVLRGGTGERAYAYQRIIMCAVVVRNKGGEGEGAR